MGREKLIMKLVEAELSKYLRLQTRLEKENIELPRGSLVKRKNGMVSVSVREKGRQYQIALDPEDDLLSKLKKKRYIKAGRESMNAWIDACKYMLEKGVIYDPVSIEAQLPEQYEGLEGLDIFLEGDVNPAEWKNTLNGESTFHPENLIHQTPGGVRMRSKSEVLIGTMLERRGILYKYEVQIECSSHRYSPDFEILHPELNRLVYLEHLGLIDNPDYVSRNLEKLKDYARNGIILGYNLFLTYETKEYPLTIMEINKVIDEILALEY